jgi:uncharacterized membrane protein YraQ (UPF0718 family)
MNPQLFILTWAGISPDIALTQVFTVLIFGMTIGLILHRLPLRNYTNPTLGSDVSTKKIIKLQKISLVGTTKLILKQVHYLSYYILIGILIGSMIQVFIPVSWINHIFNPEKWYAVPIAAMCGLPFYSCGGGAIPLVRSLMINGMGDGSAIAFFLVGPATRITPLMAIATIVKPFLIIVYILILCIYAMMVGILLN